MYLRLGENGKPVNHFFGIVGEDEQGILKEIEEIFNMNGVNLIGTTS